MLSKIEIQKIEEFANAIVSRCCDPKEIETVFNNAITHAWYDLHKDEIELKFNEMEKHSCIKSGENEK